MKNFTFLFKRPDRIAAYAFFLVWTLFLSSCGESEIEQIPEREKNFAGAPPLADTFGTAILISAGASKIGQELALLERLNETGELDNVQFIGGVSSGGILAVALNALLDKTNPFKWEDIKRVLFALRTDSIFVNHKNYLPLDNANMRRMLDGLTNQIGIRSISKDLKIPTILTTVRVQDRKLTTITNIPLIPSITDNPVDALMSTAAIPIIFPFVKIDNVDYMDGGSEEVIPIKEMLEYQELRGKPFKKIIFVSFQRDKSINWLKEVTAAGFTGKGRDFIAKALEKSGHNPDYMLFKSFIAELKKFKEDHPDVAANAKVYFPAGVGISVPYFPLLDFNREEEQYKVVHTWALTHNPVSLNFFLFARSFWSDLNKSD